MQEVEEQLSRLQEMAVDQQSLLATISQDKETISRSHDCPSVKGGRCEHEIGSPTEQCRRTRS